MTQTVRVIIREDNSAEHPDVFETQSVKEDLIILEALVRFEHWAGTARANDAQVIIINRAQLKLVQ